MCIQVNRKNIIPVVKVTITTFSLYEGPEVVEITNLLVSVEGQPTKAVLAETFTSVFFIRTVPHTFFQCLFFQNRKRTDADNSLRNTPLKL
jgi:hypothetical protein